MSRQFIVRTDGARARASADHCASSGQTRSNGDSFLTSRSFIAAAQVRENWLSCALIVRRMLPDGEEGVKRHVLPVSWRFWTSARRWRVRAPEDERRLELMDGVKAGGCATKFLLPPANGYS